MRSSPADIVCCQGPPGRGAPPRQREPGTQSQVRERDAGKDSVPAEGFGLRGQRRWLRPGIRFITEQIQRDRGKEEDEMEAEEEASQTEREQHNELQRSEM